MPATIGYMPGTLFFWCGAGSLGFRPRTWDLLILLNHIDVRTQPINVVHVWLYTQ